MEGSADEDALDLLLVLVSELATNAVSHARTDFTLVVAWDGATAAVRVGDGNTRVPQPCHVPLDATSGRGLSIVDAFSDRWGVDRRSSGKETWFEIALPTAEGRAESASGD